MLYNISHHANIINDKSVFDNILSKLIISNAEVFSYLYIDDQDGGKNLSIDEVREINKIVHTKTINKRYIVISKRIFSTNTQNALLKILEELNNNICFLFFVENTNALLTTLLSRVNILTVLADNVIDLKSNHIDSYSGNFLNIEVETLYKQKLNLALKNKKYTLVENILNFKNYYNRGALPEKNFIDFLKVL